MKVTSESYSINNNFLLALELIAEQNEIYFTTEIEEQYFIFKPLGRRTFREIEQNYELTDFEKEDAVCKAALLFPMDFDFDNCLAGIPTALSSEILEKSFLSTVEQFSFLIERSREQTNELDSQMTLIINEAFPNYRIEEIEDWDMFKFCKMFAQAEWKLRTLRSSELSIDILDLLKEYSESINNEPDGNINNEQTTYTTRVQKEEPQENKPSSKKKMTPEQERAYREAMAKFPEIQWDKDVSLNGFDESSNPTSFSTVTPALRPGWGR